MLISRNNKTFSNEAIVAFFGGFFGAFFAFTFGRLADFIGRERERYLKHKNAMVRMEYAIVKHQDMVSRLTYLLDGTIKIISAGKFTHNRFSGLNVLEDIELELADIGLINEVANYWQSVERVNSDCSSLNRIIEMLQELILSGKRPHKDNFDHLVEQMGSLKQYVEDLFIKENIELNARLRIILEKDRKQSGIQKFIRLYRITDAKIDPANITKLKKQINKEIDKRVKEDSARLAKFKLKKSPA